jgi:hypothetical protein
MLAMSFALAAPAAFAQADISLQVGGTKYQASGQGECKAAPRASIYGVNAAPSTRCRSARAASRSTSRCGRLMNRIIVSLFLGTT